MIFFISLRFIQNDSNTQLKKRNTSLSLQTLKLLYSHQHHLNSLPLHYGITTDLSKTADSGYESDAEICL
jgi:hypothetical protein